MDKKDKNNSYRKPVVTAIELHSEQAILAACRVGGDGFYFSNLYCANLGGFAGTCTTAVKATQAGTYGAMQQYDLPS